MVLPQWFRRVLMATALLNMLGAALFAPPFPALRAVFGIPEAGHPLYGWIVALWILCFGFGYGYLATAPTPERLFVITGGVGKAVFSLLLIAYWLVGDLPPVAPLAGITDLCFAVIFGIWLYRTRRDHSPARA